MKNLLLFWLLLMFIGGFAWADDKIYRVVDKDGNVTYTDQKPDDDAEPVDLPELNVLDQDDEPPILAERQSEERAGLGFRIVSPEPDAVLSADNPLLDVRMDININIPPTAQIVIFIDEQPMEPVRSLETTVALPLPGEHLARAELQTPGGRALASTDPVRFQVVPAGELE